EYLHITVSGHEQYFGLQESVVAEQLLQNSEHGADDIFWLAHSVYPFAKEQFSTRVSSIFMRMLFLPGVFHDCVLLATFRDLQKHFTISEFRSLSADGIRKELISLMEHQGASRSPRALLYNWKNFYSRYLHNWSHENAPCGLLLDTCSGAIGLIRKSSISLLRSLEDIELLSFGYGAPGLIYESFFSEPSLEDIVGRLVKVLQTGYTSSIRDLHISEPSVDNAWENGRRDHKTHRKFSVNMLSSLQRLCQKAETWGNVVTVIKFYLDSLVAQKIDNSADCEMGFDITTCITVQVTSQVAKVIFDSAVDILILLSYMVKLAGQINMLPEDISRIQLELLPLLQKIITQRSTSGNFSLVGGNLVTWRSKKQKVVSLSSAAAEFRGIDKGLAEALWIRKLVSEIGFPPREST
nr:hypothetical protein [Tanacetum cinerariifolium]